jgi:hypothetical protein
MVRLIVTNFISGVTASADTMDVLRPPLVWAMGQCYRKNITSDIEEGHKEGQEDTVYQGELLVKLGLNIFVLYLCLDFLFPWKKGNRQLLKLNSV